MNSAEITVLLSCSGDVVHNVIRAYKGLRGLDQLKQCVATLKGELEGEEDYHERIMAIRREELQGVKQKLLDAERATNDKANSVKERVLNRCDSMRIEFEKSLQQKDQEVKRCYEVIMDVNKKNSEEMVKLMLEMKQNVKGVMNEYYEKINVMDNDIRATFEQILQIHTEYKERVDKLNQEHRETIRAKQKDHAEALKQKDMMLNNILLMTYEIHRDILSIQERRAEDAVQRSIIGRNHGNMALEYSSDRCPENRSSEGSASSLTALEGTSFGIKDGANTRR